MNAFRSRTAAPVMFAALCFLATVAGCQSHKSNAAASAKLGSGLTTAMLTDASFNGMQAAQVAVPKGWHVQGQMGSVPCSTLPSPSWDATSPDGHSQMNTLPTFGWKWGMVAQNRNGCIPLSGPLGAADFLQKFAARLNGVRVVGTMPICDKFRMREENFTNSAKDMNAHLPGQFQARNSGDVAAIEAVDSTGHEMRLRAWVQCEDHQRVGGSCFARVDVLRAPKGHLNALVALVDGRNLWQFKPTQQWQTAYANRQQEIANGQMEQLRRNEDAGNRMLHDQYVNSTARMNANHNAFMGQMQQQQANHEAFMGQMQSSTNSSMRNTQNSMNARSTAASDMQDYSLDQQTVSGANGTYKTSSQYSNVWSSPYGPANSDGRTFGSMNNTIDPNTATDNTWTKDTKVHGNGRPY